ncbi:MAG: methyltransferase [Rhodospirillales bacterium CG15_BIG_FIL_POST_REV_8_21_14_020_66_15]|nr:MAG: methyltransferase [Rhodospirillales bacterium CG15_BIG_FIL_POST_REV_8_21_14_020_66_15]
MTGLRNHLRRRIALEGPLTVARYMEECLGNPRHGYYMTRDPLGRAGDFTTAPEISQMFGELIGLWAAVQWRAMGGPGAVHLVELGPGRGTLMADALRAAGQVPEFRAAAHVHLVETGPVLRERQRETLATAHPDVAPKWWNDLSQVPDGPAIAIANEFFDALPIRQFLRGPDGWRERLVGWDEDAGGLAFVRSGAQPTTPLIPPPLDAAPEGGVVEICPAGLRKAHTLAARLAAQGGAALIVDYGHDRSAPGDTLQAVKGHEYAGVLDDPGDVDLTAHVDFQQLANVCIRAGAATFGPVGQGDFLSALGIRERAAALTARAGEDQRADIEAALDRLTGADQMGRLFRVLAVQHPRLPRPSGFEQAV